MIYTVTMNPALDYIVYLNEYKTGELNRTKSEKVYLGGKGINVSVVLQAFDMKSTALGFIAGFTGKEIEQRVRLTGVETDFIWLPEGMSRINVKIKERVETELNASGPDIGPMQMSLLYQKLEKLKKEDTLVLAGSLPKTAPKDCYQTMIQMATRVKAKVVVDTYGELLKGVLPYHPFLIKPNKKELEDFFGITIQSIDEAFQYARRLKDMGAVNVMVSLGEQGALLVDENQHCYYQEAEQKKAVNTVGAGDSMVAGFLAGYEIGGYETALACGVDAGSKTAFQEGLVSKKQLTNWKK